MSIFDALTVMGAGAARGYRGAQDKRRREAIEERRRLLEEEQEKREAEKFEMDKKSAASRLEVDALERRKLLAEFDRLDREAARSRRPLGRPLKIGGFEIPNPEVGDIQDPNISRLLDQQMQGDLRTRYPELFGRGGSTPRPKTRTELFGPLIGRVFTRTPNFLEARNPELFRKNNEMLVKALTDELRKLESEGEGEDNPDPLGIEEEDLNDEENPLDLE